MQRRKGRARFPDKMPPRTIFYPRSLCCGQKIETVKGNVENLQTDTRSFLTRALNEGAGELEAEN